MKNLRFFGTPFVLVCSMLCVGQAQQTQPTASSKTAVNQASRPYLLGPGDVIEVIVYGADINKNFQVEGDGNLNLPFLEAIVARCRSERQVQKDITEAYRRLIKEPQISVRLVERNSPQPAAVAPWNKLQLRWCNES